MSSRTSGSQGDQKVDIHINMPFGLPQPREKRVDEEVICQLASVFGNPGINGSRFQFPSFSFSILSGGQSPTQKFEPSEESENSSLKSNYNTQATISWAANTVKL